ncbi:AbgT family transporter [Fusibacter ferrireducens]|uniref:YfcC family protein n=1 Tax=Fusibacter ferrireducens TaxID=2785058 RepID=A0ABR9ZTV2_9FIRM|nr:AbgT family transporter [Fusibacter ferrireducens]MBF4693911.1 YfcC family protein [Fusibacter ferrireducens]
MHNHDSAPNSNHSLNHSSNHALNISTKTFISAALILILLLIGSGILTRVIPMGSYNYIITSTSKTIIPNSYHEIEGAPLPIYKWFTAPIEVLFTSEGIIIITIILFLLIIGGAIGILNEVKVLNSIISQVVQKFRHKKYHLIWAIVFIFMSLGAFIGIFEEVIPLVPLLISLSLALGFDVMTGLGMSLLATGFGFAAAVSNPFTIGVAQRIANIPVFSGAGYRLVIFFITYTVLSSMLVKYAKSIEIPTDSDFDNIEGTSKKAVLWFLICTTIMVILILLSPLVPLISAYNLPIIGLLFLISGIGSGLLSDRGVAGTLKIFKSGATAMLPGVILILLATGVKHVIQTGNIMDSLLYYASESVTNASPFTAVLLVYLLVFALNFFIGSGSAKAFIVIPIIAPLMDMMGISRQMAILAFQFGDGFSNILYPTNAVLLIGIGLAGVSYVKWFKWVFKFQLIIGLLSILFLWIGLQLGY